MGAVGPWFWWVVAFAPLGWCAVVLLVMSRDWGTETEVMPWEQ